VRPPRRLPGELLYTSPDPDFLLLVPYPWSMNRTAAAYESYCATHSLEPIGRSSAIDLLGSLPALHHLRFAHKTSCHCCAELRAQLTDTHEDTASLVLDPLGVHLVQVIHAQRSYQADCETAKRAFEHSTPALSVSTLCMSYCPPVGLPGRQPHPTDSDPHPLQVNCFAVANEGGSFVNAFFTDEGYVNQYTCPVCLYAHA
jgi:hypothetical protein